jgi:4'-phosphopantetheinyl transferase
VRPADVSIVQRCATCGGPHGRPEVAGHPDIGVSLAHSHGVVAAAAGTVPVGIDVEAFPPADGLAAVDLSAALTAAEIGAIESAPDRTRAMLLAWVRKEACLKAGLVDLDELGGFDLSALPLDPPPGDLVVRSLEHGGWAVHDWWDGRAGAIGAVVAPVGAELQLDRA